MDILPSELWEQIMLYMDYTTIRNFRNSSKYVKYLCMKMRKLLVAKFSKDLFNVSNFTKQQHDFYERTKLIKNRMRMVYASHDNYLIINYNDYYVTIFEKIEEMKDNII